MGRLSLAFLDQNLFISSLALVPIGTALQKTHNQHRKPHLPSQQLKAADRSFHLKGASIRLVDHI